MTEDYAINARNLRKIADDLEERVVKRLREAPLLGDGGYSGGSLGEALDLEMNSGTVPGEGPYHGQGYGWLTGPTYRMTVSKSKDSSTAAFEEVAKACEKLVRAIRQAADGRDRYERRNTV